MSRPIWNGTISFGLVQIPVGLVSAESPDELRLHLLDRRTMEPIRYERLGRYSGKPVPWEEIVKGYELDKDKYVVLTEADFKRASVEKTETIDILGFIASHAVPPHFYERPYYLAPAGKGMAAKAYALLRETLKRTARIGVAKVVLRSRQHLAALLVEGDVLLLMTLRYANELRPVDFDVPGSDLRALDVSEREIEMAEHLVEGMDEGWDPARYRDDYREDLLALIQERARKGELQSAPEDVAVEGARRESVVDIMTLLQRSLERRDRAKEQQAATRRAGERPRSNPHHKRKHASSGRR